MKVLEWILENKNWLFSGVGVFLITMILRFVNKKNRGNQKSETIPHSGNSVVIDGDENKNKQANTSGTGANFVSITGDKNTNDQKI